MARMTQYAFAPDRALVYRKTGELVRGDVTYSTNRNMLSQTGYTVVGNRVYYKGRLQGYAVETGKASKTQQKRINRTTKSRSKKPTSKATQQQTARDEFTAIEDAISYGGVDLTKRGAWDTVAMGKRAIGNFQTGINTYFEDVHRVFLSYQETRQLNFASGLSQSVDNNVITVEEANNLWERYINSESDDERSALWDELNKKNDEMGYEIESPPLYEEMASELGIDYTMW